MASDPIGDDLVPSLAHPRGKITGVTTDAGPVILSKQLELLLEAAPDCTYIACLGTIYTNAGMRSLWRDARSRNVGVQEFLVHRHFGTGSARERYTNAFSAMLRDGAKAVLVLDNVEHLAEAATISELALKHRLPLISRYRPLTEIGGLMSYGPNWVTLERRRAAMWRASWTGRNLNSCRSSSHRNSSLWSILPALALSTAACPRRCSPSRTNSSNDLTRASSKVAPQSGASIHGLGARLRWSGLTT